MRLVPNIPVARRFMESQIFHIADSLNKDKWQGREHPWKWSNISKWNLQLFQKGEAWLISNSSLFVLTEDKWIKTKAKTISLAFTDFILTKLIARWRQFFFSPKYMIEVDAEVIPPFWAELTEP